MPAETSAAVLRAFGEPHSVEIVELRDPGPDEVLVRMVAAGVCHSDVGQADGEWAFPLPAVLGHEGAGVVEAVGTGVTHVAPGQRVVLSLAPGCGGCDHCLMNRPILCQDALDAMGEGRLLSGPTPIRNAEEEIATYSLLGCFAGHAVVSARSVVPLRDGVPADVAALVGCAVITGFGAATETIDVAPGTRGAVIGTGGVGMNAIQGARVRGAAEIDAFDVSPERIEHARRFGATGGVDVRDDDELARLRQRAPRHGYDWTIVTVGRPDSVQLGVELTRPGGTTVVVGLLPESTPVALDMLELVTYEKKVVGSAYGSTSPQILIPVILRLYLEGKLLLDELVTDRLPLGEIDEAFARSRRADGLRPVLALSDGGAFA